jgi:hypothetical protein
VQDSHFLWKWFGQSFPRAYSFSPGCTLFIAGGMAQIGEWSRFNNQGQAFPRADLFSPGCTFFSAGGMTQIGEWSRLRNRDNYSSLLEKNSPDSSSLMFYLLKGNCSSKSHRCEWKNGPDDSVYIITMFSMQIDDMIVMETVCLRIVDVYYCGGCVPLIVTICH